MTERESIMKEFGLRDLTDEQLIRCLGNQLRRALEALKDLDGCFKDAEKAKTQFEQAETRRNIMVLRAQKLAREYSHPTEAA